MIATKPAERSIAASNRKVLEEVAIDMYLYRKQIVVSKAARDSVTAGSEGS